MYPSMYPSYESDPGLDPALGAMRDALLYDETVLPVRPFETWKEALSKLFPTTFHISFSEAQKNYWSWVWSIQPKVRPRPYVLLLPRGGGKTTSCEVTPILLGADNIRNYCWYIQETQTQADKRIEYIAEKLESVFIATHYPQMNERWIGKYGNVGGWRRSYVRTASNIVFEAVGLDKAVRSAKSGDRRPDVIIIDDIDSKYDTAKSIARKIGTLTHTLLPAATSDAVIIFVQNLMHPHSIASKLANSKDIDFLQDRIISGPYPALTNFEHMRVYDEEIERDRTVIIQGTPLWDGQGILECQNYIDTYGLTSFNTECQQEVDKIEGSIWEFVEFRHCNVDEVPKMEIGCVWCDPAVTETDSSDCQGIQADGMDKDGNIYRFMSQEQRDSPLRTVKTAIIWCVELGFTHVGIETDQGGDTWKVVFDKGWDDLCEDPEYLDIGHTTLKPRFHQAKAGAGYGSKAHRNNLMLAGYEEGNVLHVRGYHEILESSLYRFLRVKPYDLADAAFWSWDFLKHRRWRTKQADAR